VELWPLIFSRQLHVTELTLDQPQIDLLQSAAGDWNLSSLGGKSAAAAKPTAPPSEGFNLSVKLVEIANGRLTFAAQNGKTQARVAENVNVELDGFSANARFPFKLTAKLAGGGDVRLNGTAGPINSANAVQTPAKVTVKLSGFNLAAAGVEHSTGLAGLLSIDGNASSNGKTVSLDGRLKAEQLKLARNGSPVREPVEFDFALGHDLRKRAGVLRRGEIHIGGAPANLTGSCAAQGESTAEHEPCRAGDAGAATG